MYIKTAKYGLVGTVLTTALHFTSHGYVAVEGAVLDAMKHTTTGVIADSASMMGYELRTPIEEKSLKQLADEVARAEGVNPQLFRALIRHESNWNPFAVSPKGAAGLAQVMPFNHKRCGVEKEKLFNPETNLICGARILREELDRYKNPEHSLQAYNGGHKCINKCKESINYAKNIINEFFKNSL